ncbi:MAG: two-component system sensor histidine kinase NtrB, partial [Candidatus Rokuibacteriota bacterium]
MVVAVALAIVAGGLAYLAYSDRTRAERLGRELAEAHEQVTRLQKLGSLGEMASSFAHSFNDVLTPIIGRSQLLAQRVTDPQAREWLGTIERAALDGAQTVRRIQEFMRMRREEPTVAVDLAAVVKQAVELTAPRQRQGVRVEVDTDSVAPIAGDPLGLREALAYVVANALEAAPEGSAVTVTTRMDVGDAVIGVADSGVGMTSAVQARIFEPFFTTKPGATGLGLCLAHGIVSRHGGQIEVDSAPGRGTTVRIRFPVEAVARGKPAAPARAA